MLQRPSDLGFSDEGYDLPPLVVRWHEVQSTIPQAVDRDGQGILLRTGATGLADESRERRATLPARVAKAAAIVTAAPSDHFILWHDLEAERSAIEQALPTARSVFGTQDLDKRDDLIMGFSDGAFELLSKKPILCGSGCNFQRH
ncbi:hypothetical protein [Lichenifustis flavocetrariae]|uniref:Uncharacterized protein n=1 Tax=Lichenifustis flavocetrariae TaxID=2949735 RepID=A0AA41YWD6_9HYPH|nr:hypothetical protein [Lichenifustis flavocetrariae]MCW6508203.1 hypothetical protein [Lichenifustis flavocetrariae]